MPSYFDSSKKKPGKAVKKYNKGGRLKSLRNEVEESRRVADRRPKDARERMDKSEELSRINREEKRDMAKGGKVQGYNARQDESIGSRNKTKGQQNLKSRRDEAQAMEKKGKKRKYSDVSTMDKGKRKKYATGGKVSCDGVAQRGLTKIARSRG